jgi:quercetin 2,3-dioxygenase
MTARRIDRVHGVTSLGPDAQVDDKQLVFPPGSFTDYDPFLMLSEDWFSQPGFEWHPHRGIETVTIVLDGALEHGDNKGSAGILAPGDVQWMTAGSGIIHRELAFRNEHVHSLQLWVNLPRTHKMVEARYQDVRASDQAVVDRDGVHVSVISGRAGDAVGPAENHWPITGLLVTLDPGSTWTQELPTHDRAFAYVLAGQLLIGGRRVDAGNTAWSDPVGSAGTSSLSLAALDGDRPARVMLFSGRPIREQVVAGGPFVMNSHAEIEQAFRDFHSGRFGAVPRQARLRSKV